VIPIAQISLLSAIVTVIVGVLIYGQNPTHAVSRMFLIVCGLVFYFDFTEFEFLQAADVNVAFQWLRLAAFWYLLPLAVLHLCIIYANLKPKGAVVYSMYALAILFSVVEILVAPYELFKMPWGWAYHYTGYYGYVQVAWVTIPTIAALPVLIRRHSVVKTRKEKAGIAYVFSGVLIPIVTGILVTVLPFLTSEILPDLTAPAVAVGFLVVGYGVLRQGSYMLTANVAAQDIIQTMSDALFIVNTDNEIVQTNEAGCRLVGYAASEIVGKELGFLMEGSSGLKTSEQDCPNTFDTYFKTRNGTNLPVFISRTTIATKAGLTIGYALVIRDITERKRLEEELQAAKKRLEYVITSNPAVIYTGKPGSDCSGWSSNYISDRVTAMLGFEPREFINHPDFWQSRIHPDDLRATLAATSHLKDGHYACDYRFQHKDGRYRWIREETRLIRDSSDKPREVVGCWTDITELKDFEQRLQRTERLAAIGEAAAMVGHDLRNPLQATTSTLYVVKKLLTSGKPEERDQALGLLDDLDGEVYYMDKIVSDLQDYSRLSIVDAELVETNLPELIRDVISNVKIPPSVSVSAPVGGEDPLKAVVNPVLLRRVLVNLILNAVQAMPNGGRLTLAVGKAQNSASISVQDTGTGIPAEDLEKIFNPFFTTKAQGQGLGLAVCERLVEAQGGEITVTSEVGKGSTFTVKLRTKEAARAEDIEVDKKRIALENRWAN